jgi:hypothetical protein
MAGILILLGKRESRKFHYKNGLIFGAVAQGLSYHRRGIPANRG